MLTFVSINYGIRWTYKREEAKQQIEYKKVTYQVTFMAMIRAAQICLNEQCLTGCDTCIL